MRVLIINMAAATDRMAFMAAQMRHFGFDWERIEAVTPATLSPPAADPVWHRWQRPLRVTEMALCASHMAAWRRVLALDAPCLVLEDDAVLASGLPGFLQAVDGLDGVEHISLETRGRKKLVARVPHPAAPIRRLWQDRTGSAAYVVTPAGARKLLRHAAKVGGPSDAIISATYDMASYQADPGQAIQLDQCAAYDVQQAIPTTSLIDAVRKPAAMEGYSTLRRYGFRGRRIMAQIRMGLRQVPRVFTASRRHIAPAEDWPEIRIGTPGDTLDAKGAD
ncbi:glycosyltransferase family 25 protein [Rhodophyticola porphyridii]|uniref:glycosyltransferase family 25 protein n=1 Tax=Rhodophyticola porphyridii TaxID=1852017 RepID=UPI0035D05217